MAIWDIAQTALATLGVPFGAGVRVPVTPGGALPEMYLVYFVVDIMPAQHADDEETQRDWLVQVSVYSRAGLAGLPDIIGAMTAAGFQFSAGRQLDYDPETRHFGLALDFEYLEEV